MKYFKFLIVLLFGISVYSQYSVEGKAFCLKCHSLSATQAMDSLQRKPKKLNVTSNNFDASNHGNMDCLDCHDAQFENVPHPEGVSKPDMSCLGCHDESEKGFSYVEIEEEFQKSVHVTKFGEEFTCYSCHDPHSFKLNARINEEIKKVVLYDNHICLNCHKLETVEDEKGLNQIHEFLPHPNKHWENVRCVDCHTDPKKNGLSHNILDKSGAVKNCVECHSTDSRLLQTLYQFKKQKEIDEKGFFNSVILNNSYVIGATRNSFFNTISIIIFILTVLAIIVHALLRWKSRKGANNGK